MLREVRTLIENNDLDNLFKWCYEHDTGFATKKELESAAEGYKYLVSQNDGMAANNLGSMYYCGRYFKEDREKAIEYYEMAREMGTVLAWSNLGCCYYYSDHPDYRQAYEIFAEGAYLFNDVECLYMLGDMYRDGKYVDKSEVKPLHLYFKAMDSINDKDERGNSLRGEIYYRIGRTLLLDKHDPLEAMKNLSIGLGLLYENINANKWMKETISNCKGLMEMAELEIAQHSYN